jgi:ATP-dependent Lon protease
MVKRAGTKNPVFLLDEVDKMSMDFRGDPASALMEVLDPEQNSTFLDHYIDTDFDLSQVMFIVTANMLEPIPRPLIDRMEVIRLPGYTEDEKLQIGKRFLIPKQMKAHGLKAANLKITDAAMQKIIREYTREAGVRNLEREITSVCRKLVKRVVEKGKEHGERVTPRNLESYLGIPKFRRAGIDKKDEIGGAIGMAWTEFGGELLIFEATKVHGKGTFTLTGQLGEIMQESAQAAFSYVRGKVYELNIARIAKNFDITFMSRGRDPQGRAVRRHHHRHLDHLAPDRHPRQPEGRHDGRDHLERQGPAGRWREGKTPGGAPRGDPRGHHPARQQSRPQRPAQGDQAGGQDPSGRTHGRSLENSP